ncbi:MAG: hypothetical protein HY744_11800 [Deltaproteobacteria bacterium]|nr:hypothetical protein [Deltaproteobacteria bacterium]
MKQAPPPSSPRQRRRLRNFLLDRRLQLKYAGYLVAVAALVGLGLGLLLWRTSRSLVAQSHQTLEQGRQAVALGRRVAEESRKVGLVVKMSITRAYGDAPELAASFAQDSAKQEALLAEQEGALEAQAASLAQRAQELGREQRTMLATLVASFALLVVAIGLGGIVVTHKVAGPVLKMTRQIRELGAGSWRVPDPLRRGDELGGFFAAFEQTVRALRAEREEQVAAIEASLAELRGKIEPAELEPLARLAADMKRAIAPEVAPQEVP